MSSRAAIPTPLLAEGKPRRVRTPESGDEYKSSAAGLRRIAARASILRLRRARAYGRPSGLEGEAMSRSLVVMDGGR